MMCDKILLFASAISFVHCSSLYSNVEPEVFTRERYLRDRGRVITDSLNHAANIEVPLDFVRLVKQHNYPAEEHRVTTKDGYILRVHRIPGSPTKPKAKGKPVVLFQHGILASTDTWIILGPKKDLAYMLVDAGYDVWLNNARGNTYSRSHVKLSPDKDPEFWQFSFHEIAMFDMPVVIDYILQETGEKSIIYIGHSMGSTISYILLSMKPEYNEKIKLLISMAPVAFWHAQPRAPIMLVKVFFDFIQNFLASSRIYEFLPLTLSYAHLGETSCSKGKPFEQLCLNIAYFIFGYSPDQLDTSLIPYTMYFFPAGVSAKTLMHYSQSVLTGDFRMYDYGTIKNLQKYHNVKPPSYNISNIVTPVALIYGQGDAIVSPENPIELSKKLRKLVTIEEIPEKNFNHIDFLISKDIKTLLNDRVMKIIENTLEH